MRRDGTMISSKIKPFEEVNCNELLTIPTQQMHGVTIPYCLRNLLYCLLKSRFRIEQLGNGKHLFFFTPSYSSRKEYENQFKDTAACVENSTVFIGDNNLGFNIINLKFLPKWLLGISELKKCGYSLTEAFYLANKLLECVILKEQVCSVIKRNQWKPELAVTFCDTHPIDYYLTSYFNSLGIRTITLQHAAYYHKTHGFEYKNSHSNYFLAVSDYAVAEAEKSHYPSNNKMIVCGPLKYLSSSDHASLPTQLGIRSGLFGIALSGPSFKESNQELINYGKFIQDRYGLKAVLRPHPALQQEYIDTICKGLNYRLSKGSMVEFGKECRFVILGNTNTFADLIALGVPTLRMISNDELDFFEVIPDMKFSDEDELVNQIDLINRNGMEDIIAKWSDFVCPKGNIKERYISTFNRIINQGGSSK